MTLDVRTLYIAMGISCFLVAGSLLFFQARQFVRDGVLEWIAGYALQGSYWILLGLRGIIPDILSILAANVFLTANYSLLYAAVRQFQHHSYRRDILVLPSMITLIFFSFFFFSIDSIYIRTVYIASVSFIQMAVIALVLFRDAPFQIKRSQWLTGCFFAVGALLWLTRLLDIFFSPQQNLILGVSPVRTVLLMFGFGVVILTSIGFLLMIHERTGETLRESEERFRDLVENSAALISTSDLEGNLLSVNEMATRLSGYSRESLLHMNMSKFLAPEVRHLFGAYLNEIRSQGWSDGIMQVQTASGETRYWEYHNTLRSEGVAVPIVRGMAQDITERKEAEEIIRSLLHEKELLLKEVHHRIKNNMSTIASLLSLQAGTQSDPLAVAALNDARSRVMSMGVIYDKLYRSSDFSNVSAKEYLENLIDEISATFPTTAHVNTETHIEELSMDSKILFPLGIIINELITNAHKYAFPEGRKGTIAVSLSRIQDNVFELTVRDNGTGIPGTVDIEHSPGFGLSLVKDLVMQIDGTFQCLRDAGTEFRIEFRCESE